jgi:hypothetical protein
MRDKGAGRPAPCRKLHIRPGGVPELTFQSLAASGLHARAGIETGAKGERYRGAFSPCETCCGLDGLVGNVKDKNRLLVLCGAIKLIHEILLFDPRRLDRPNAVYSRNAFGSIRPTRPKREPVAQRLWGLARSPAVRRAADRRARIFWVALNVRTTWRIGESPANGAGKQQYGQNDFYGRHVVRSYPASIIAIDVDRADCARRRSR